MLYSLFDAWTDATHTARQYIRARALMPGAHIFGRAIHSCTIPSRWANPNQASIHACDDSYRKHIDNIYRNEEEMGDACRKVRLLDIAE